jgi:ParB-like chromosome segregation protein Spo0J
MNRPAPIVELPVDAVVVNGRIRQDLGNLDELAASIAKRGLLHPLILRPGNVLVAGLRRLEACKLLGWPTVPVRVVATLADTLRALEAEREENTCRLDFTPSEAVAAAAPMEALQRQEARRRQATSTGGIHPRLKESACGKLPQGAAGRTRERVAAEVGMSGRTYGKAKEIVRAAEANPAHADLVRWMDRERNVDRPYRVLRRRQQERRRELAASADDGLAESVRQGDFRTVLADLPDQSVSLIFTDPPYDAASLPIYGDLAALAARVLIEGGSLVCYAPPWTLPQVLPLLTAHLHFQWQFAVIHTGPCVRMHGWRVQVGWKPLLWLTKGRYEGPYVRDRIESRPGNKDHHEWAQGAEEALHVIGPLCPEGGLVLDPMCGSGTTLRAARQLGRRYLGVEMDADRARVASALLAAAPPGPREEATP